MLKQISISLFITICTTTIVHAKYNRHDYRHWIDADNDCQDTRQEVLIRDSISYVIFDTQKKCHVKWGMWLDDYTGMIIYDPSKIDIDHVVSLKEIDTICGSKWSKKKKMMYANYLDDNEHLKAVFYRANRQKGSKGHEVQNKWLPSNDEYIEHYIELRENIISKWCGNNI